MDLYKLAKEMGPTGWVMGQVQGLREDLGWPQCPVWSLAGVGAFAELGTWEERLGSLEGDTELKLSSKVSLACSTAPGREEALSI